jgi:hypothetical protein
MNRRLFATLLIVAVLLVSLAPVAFATGPIGQGDRDLVQKGDNRADPLSSKQAELKEKAVRGARPRRRGPDMDSPR